MIPDGLLAALAAQEAALAADDAATLDALLAPGPATLRGDGTGLLVGHEAISRFGSGRGGAPRRTVVETHVQRVDDDHATVVAVTELARGGRGLQTQTWARADGTWRITSAHVSIPPPALDPTVWRVLGTPLVTATASGPLDGVRVAVKDLYAVAGHRVGAGNPTWLAHAPVETEHAWAVARLLGAGADVTGISRTDELAYSLAGTNAHTGTPPNPRAPQRISGGSSSGSASAVALGQVDVGLGTDTGGSVRVPAAYQGLWGLRTSHGLVPRDGLLPLAPSFDTVGWLTRDATTLLRVGQVLLPPGAGTALGPDDLVTVDALLALAEPDVQQALAPLTDGLPRVRPGRAGDGGPELDLAGWLTAFQTWQAVQAWAAHGAWLADRLDALGDDVRPRFTRGRDTSAQDAETARGVVEAAGEAVRALVGDRVLVLPSASSVAPPRDDVAAQLGVREATMRLTILAGLGGLPALSVPRRTASGLPCGVCLLAAPGRDRELLALGVELAGRHDGPAPVGAGDGTGHDGAGGA